MKLRDLKPNPSNPRKIDSERLVMLKKSLDEFGDLSGFVFNESTRRLVGGHQRQKALPDDTDIFIEEKYAEPTHTGTTAIGYVVVDGEKYAYRQVAWTEEKEMAANIAANKHGGEWDAPKLADWLLDLDQKNYDLDLTGFTAAEIEDVCAPYRTMPDETNEDQVPPTPQISHVKMGDLFLLGSHRLLCGDSTVASEVNRLMNGEKADMVFTSPPYNLGVSAQLSGNTQIGNLGNAYTGYDDDQSESDWLSLVSGATLTAMNHSRYAFVNLQFLAGNRTALSEYWYAFREKICDIMVWDKGHAQPAGAERVLNSRFEFIFIFTSDDNPNRAIRIAPQFRGTIDNVYAGKPQRSNEFAAIHGATFPVEFPETFITNFCPTKGSVIDPFSGSGTTLIACEKTNRKCYGMEIDPHYCSVILDRWEKYSGKDAVREDGKRWKDIQCES